MPRQHSQLYHALCFVNLTSNYNNQQQEQQHASYPIVYKQKDNLVLVYPSFSQKLGKE